MKRFVVISITAMLLLGSSGTSARYIHHIAAAQIRDRYGKEVGLARFRQAEGWVEMKVRIHSLPPGEHGIHIHEVGSCIPPDFKSAGGHYNPTHMQHGMDNPMGSHAGDMPNLVVDQNGKGKMTALIKNITVFGPPPSLMATPGTSVVIHASHDDYHTDPSGNSGARIACGVIKPF